MTKQQNTHARTFLIFGGARSGKSRRAEQIVKDQADQLGTAQKIYIATAEVYDDEMAARVHQHQGRRDQSWQTREVPLGLAPALINDVRDQDVVLVDCLTLWLSNLMAKDLEIEKETDALVSAISKTSATLVFVSNEVGLGIVPDNALARKFRDAQGLLNQKVAAAVEHVEFVAAGLPLQLKP